MPRGFKFVAREELQKRDVQKALPKKKAFTVNLSETMPLSQPPPPPPPKPKPKKQEEYQPEKKNMMTPLVFPVEEQPSGTSIKLLERLKRHPAFAHLELFRKVNQTDMSLKEVE